MELLVALKQLIPGYELLTHEQHTTFLNTEAGEKIALFLASLKPGFWNLEHGNETKERIERQFRDEIPRLLLSIKHTDEYLRVKTQIICMQALKKYPYFKGIIDDPERMLERLNGDLDDPQKIQECIALWHDEICAVGEAYMPACFSQRAERLARFFPLLANQSRDTDGRIIDEWFKKYQLANGSVQSNISGIERAQLTTAIYFVLYDKTRSYDAYLHNFNFQYAESIATQILDAFNDGKTIDIKQISAAYRAAALTNLQEKLLQINQKKWKPYNGTFQGAQFSAISSIVDQFADKLALMADGHAIIQATGFATQNESSYLAFLDFVNYWRYAQKLSEVKTIFSGLLQPLLPLYLEYRSIGMNETNMWFKSFRTIVPALIIASVVVSVFSLLTTFALPELAALVVLIPTLYVGAIIATQFVLIRDSLHKMLKELYYDGEYKTDLYHINIRMLRSFVSESVAELVRDYYIEELSQCDKFELGFSAKDKQGILNTSEIAKRKENTIRKNQLTMEWLDIHNNHAFGTDKVKQLVSSRFHRDGDIHFQALCEQFNTQDKAKLESAFDDITENITACFENRVSSVQSSSNITFFKPACAERKKTLESIDTKNQSLGLSS